MSQLLRQADDKFDRVNEQQTRRVVDSRISDQEGVNQRKTTSRGGLALGEGSITLANGANNNVSLDYATHVRIIGPTAAFTITGFKDGEKGAIYLLRNSTNYSMTIANNSGSSSANNRIYTQTGNDVVLNSGAGAVCILFYDTVYLKWIIMPGAQGLHFNPLYIKTSSYIDFGDGDFRLVHSSGVLDFVSSITGTTAGITTGAQVYTYVNGTGHSSGFTVNSINSNGGGDGIYCQTARGSVNSPAILHSGDFIGQFGAWGHDGTGFKHVASIAAYVDGTPGAGDMPGRLEFYTSPDGAITQTLRMLIDCDGNIKVGGTAARGTTAGTNQLVLFNGTAPVGTLTNGVSIYSTAGEMRVMDSAGNATLLSPHDHDTNEWIYHSVDTRTGKGLHIEMERLMRALNDYLGTDYVHEF